MINEVGSGPNHIVCRPRLKFKLDDTIDDSDTIRCGAE